MKENIKASPKFTMCGFRRLKKGEFLKNFQKNEKIF